MLFLSVDLSGHDNEMNDPRTTMNEWHIPFGESWKLLRQSVHSIAPRTEHTQEQNEVSHDRSFIIRQTLAMQGSGHVIGASCLPMAEDCACFSHSRHDYT